MICGLQARSTIRANLNAGREEPSSPAVFQDLRVVGLSRPVCFTLTLYIGLNIQGNESFPITVIAPSPPWWAIRLGEVWRYRELLYFLAWRDIKVRYKQAALGVLWAVIQPFVKMVVFSLVFGRLAGIDSGGFPYPVFVYAGLLPWGYFADAVTRSGHSLVAGASIVRKAYVPRLIMPVASASSTLFD